MQLLSAQFAGSFANKSTATFETGMTKITCSIDHTVLTADSWPNLGRQNPAPVGNQLAAGDQAQGTNESPWGNSEHLGRQVFTGAAANFVSVAVDQEAGQTDGGQGE